MGWALYAGGAAVVAAGAAAFALACHLSESAPQSAEERRSALETFCDKLANGELAGVPHVTAAQLKALFGAGERVVVVDVRTSEEQEVSMISGPPGAVVTSREFESDPGRWRGYQAVCSCTAGYRSGLYTRQLLASPQGSELASASNLRGGILACTQAGMPLVEPATGRGTRRVHVYAPRWSLQADGYTPVAFDRPLLAAIRERLSAALRGGLDGTKAD